MFMGDGMNRLARLVGAIGYAKGGVVLIDEIENGLHYSVLKDVWKAIGKAAREFNTQIFATTHSWECLVAAHQAFSEGEEYDFRLHRLERSSTDAIVAKTMDSEILETAIEQGWEMR
jgi:AAA15 family ATPase/GTPase